MKDINIISYVQNHIKNETGIIIHNDRLADLENVLNTRMIYHGLTKGTYLEFIKNNYDEIIHIASSFTIQETSFYRNKAHYDRFKTEIIPKLYFDNEYKKSIKILSAGCATGEEPYTMAMIFNDLKDKFEDWDIQIIATDINENAIELAKTAQYSEYKLRNIDSWYINKYFSVIKNGKSVIYNIYKLKDSIKKLVKFRQCNLIREPFELNDLQDLDIIFCENVIIYFTIESIHKLIDNFYNILKPGGYLFLGYSETLNFVEHKFELSWWKDSFAYKKTDKIENEIFFDFNKLKAVQDIEIIEEKAEQKKIKHEDFINLVVSYNKDNLYEDIKFLLKKVDNNNLEIEEVFHTAKAEFKYDKKQYIHSTNECRKAISINPHSIDAHLILGAIYLEINMLDSAAFELKTSLYIDNLSILAHYFYALYIKTINDQSYIQYMEKAKKLLDDNNRMLKTNLYPINKKKRENLINNILNLNI